MRKKYLWFIVAILYCVAIFVTTASPSSTGGSTQFLIEKLLRLSENQAQVLNVLFRKTVHLTAFGFLAFLFYNSFEKSRFFKAWILTTIYAAIDEWHQAFIPERTGSIIDVGIDSIGALLALGFIYVFIKYRQVKQLKKG